MLGTIFKFISKFISILFGVLALYVIWLDLTATNSSSIVLGQFWYEYHRVSLQAGEAIVSRYIDPCGLIVVLDCAPFLWHPLIVGLLGWPATLVFILISFIFAGFGRLARKNSPHRASKRALHRSGSV